MANREDLDDWARHEASLVLRQEAPAKEEPSSSLHSILGQTFGGIAEGVPKGLGFYSDVATGLGPQAAETLSSGLIGEELLRENLPPQGVVGETLKSYVTPGVNALVGEPQDLFERAGRGTGEFIGENLASLGLGQAAKASKVAPQLGQVLSARPVAQLISSGSAGIGSAIGENYGGETGKTIGGMLGAFAPELARGGVNVLKAFQGPGSPTKSEAMKDAAKVLRDEVQLSEEDISKALEQKASHPLKQFASTAELAQNPRLKALERGLDKGIADAGDEFIEFKQRDALRKSIVQGEVPKTGKGREEFGSDFLKRFDELKETSQARIDELFESVDPARTTKIPIKDAKGRLGSYLERSSRDTLAVDRGKLGALIKQIEKSGETRPWVDLHNWRMRANEIIGASGGTEARVAKRIKDELDEVIRNAARRGTGMSKDQRRTAMKAIEGYKKHLTRFNEGIAKRIKQARPENIASKILDAGSGETKNLLKGLGIRPSQMRRNTPKTVEIKRAVVDELTKRTTAASKDIKGGQYQNIIEGKEANLRTLFGRDHFADFKQVARDLADEAEFRGVLAAAADKGSQTQPRQTVAKAIKSSISSLAARRMGVFVPAGSASAQGYMSQLQEMVNKELLKVAADPRHARTLLRLPTEARVAKYTDFLLSGPLRNMLSITNEATQSPQSEDPQS